jgi:hypothetical protein
MMAYDDWSNDLQERTRAALHELAFVSDNEVLGMKHADGRFGSILVNDVLSGIIKVKDLATENEESFGNTEDLVRAGWVID